MNRRQHPDRPRLAAGLAAGLAAFILARAVSARPPGPDEVPRPVRVALALSGGGARGFAHIGVLAGLERCGTPIDAIAGTSMGAVVGGLYALGYTPAELEQIARGNDLERVLLEPNPPAELPLTRKASENWALVKLEIGRDGFQIPAGLVATQRLAEQLSLLVLRATASTSFERLRIPFVAIAADLETGRKVVLDSGSLVTALRATTAVPGVFSPVERDGRLLVDGGILENLPVEDAASLGAELVVAVDVTSPLRKRNAIRSFVDVVDQAVGFAMVDRVAEARSRADILIVPEIGAHSSFEFSPDQAADLIACGDEAATRACPAIRAALGVGPDAPARAESVHPHTYALAVRELRIQGARPSTEQLMRRHFGALPESGFLSLEELERRMVALRALRELKNVELDYAGEHALLSLTVSEAPPLAIQLAARVDDKYGALGKAAVNWRPGLGPVRDLGVDLVFGRTTELRIGARHERLFGSPLLAFGRGILLEDFDEVPVAGQDAGELHVRRRGFEGGLGFVLGLDGLVSCGYRWEDAESEVSDGADPTLAEALEIGALVARVQVDTSERSAFPRSGVALTVGGIFADPGLGGEARYTLLDGEGQLWIPLGDRTTAYGRARVADALSGTLPELERLVAGGNDPLPGYPRDAFRGETLGIAGAGLRQRLLDMPAAVGGGLYLELEGAAGTVSGGREEFSDHGELLWGALLRASLDTWLGPFELAFGVNREGATEFTFAAGPRF